MQCTIGCEIDGTWQLESDTNIFNISFSHDGMASLTMGQTIGPTTAPIVNWSCENGILKITQHDGQLVKTLKNMKMKNNKITATNNTGAVEQYKYLAPNKASQ